MCACCSVCNGKVYMQLESGYHVYTCTNKYRSQQERGNIPWGETENIHQPF